MKNSYFKFNILILMVILCALVSQKASASACEVSKSTDSFTGEDNLRWNIEDIATSNTGGCRMSSGASDKTAILTSDNVYVNNLIKFNSSVNKITLSYKGSQTTVSPLYFSNPSSSEIFIIGNASTRALADTKSDLTYDTSVYSGLPTTDFTVIDATALPASTAAFACNTSAKGKAGLRNLVIYGQVKSSEFWNNSANDCFFNAGEAYFCKGKIPSTGNTDPTIGSQWCDGDTDEDNGAVPCPNPVAVYADRDSDGFGVNLPSAKTFCPSQGEDVPEGFVIGDHSDCNDSLANINPGVSEICDGQDNDCDGLVDADDVTGWIPLFNQNFTYNDKTPGFTSYLGYQMYNLQNNPVNKPVLGSGIVSAGGMLHTGNYNYGVTDATTFYADSDSDTYGDDSNSKLSCNTTETGYVTTGGDCNDTVATINPGMTEICGDSGSVDENCDGVVATDCGGTDHDGDGVTVEDGDCNDNDASIHPGAVEICGDGIDQDCSGADLSCDVDADGDGVTVSGGDCNDNDPTIHPGAVDICGDTIDQDCSGADLSCGGIDHDGDGFTPDGGDCNDNDDTINPAATEICADNIDQDCSGVADNGCAIEICDDGKDNDLDGLKDCSDTDDCSSFFKCNGGTKEEICNDGKDNDDDGAIDCDDADCMSAASCAGDRTETICDDGIDNDSDGFEDCLDVDCKDVVVDKENNKTCAQLSVDDIPGAGFLAGGANWACSFSASNNSGSTFMMLTLGLMATLVFVRRKKTLH